MLKLFVFFFLGFTDNHVAIRNSVFEPLSDIDIGNILKQADIEVNEEMSKLGIDVDQLEIKLHIKCESSNLLSKEDLETFNEPDDEVVDDLQISDSNTQFYGLSSDLETLETGAGIGEVDLSEAEENLEMEIDDEELVEDASGVLEPALGKKTALRHYLKTLNCSIFFFDFIGPSKAGYFRLKTTRGQEFDIKKGTLCYVYQKRDNVSIDRLYRFRSTFSATNNSCTSSESCLQTNDYVLMKSFNFVCHVLQFKLLNKKRLKDSEYPNESVALDSKNVKQMGALCTFYCYRMSTNSQLVLELSENAPLYVPLEHYLCKLPQPSSTDNDCLMYEAPISVSVVNTIEENFEIMNN